jgi:hypothetical protein
VGKNVKESGKLQEGPTPRALLASASLGFHLKLEQEGYYGSKNGAEQATSERRRNFEDVKFRTMSSPAKGGGAVLAPGTARAAAPLRRPEWIRSQGVANRDQGSTEKM